MIRGLNRLQLIGNLGKDPEMKYTQGGSPVATFSVAVSRGYSGTDGQQKEETEWFRVVAWQKLAEQCNEYLRKGSRVYIEGRLRTREWQGQDGQPQRMVEVVASEMIMLDSRHAGSVAPETAATTSGAAGAAGTAWHEAGSDAEDLDF